MKTNNTKICKKKHLKHLKNKFDHKINIQYEKKLTNEILKNCSKISLYFKIFRVVHIC